MPKIEINEQERVSSAALDITENIVLVPVFIKNETFNGTLKLYDNVDDLKSDFTNESSEDLVVKFSGKKFENSYVLAKSILVTGLKALVYFIKQTTDFTDTTETTTKTLNSFTSGTTTAPSDAITTDMTAWKAFDSERQQITGTFSINSETSVITFTTESSSTISYVEYPATITIPAVDAAASAMASALPACLKLVGNKNLYNVKFLTAGGYGQSNSTQGLLVDAAETRGDCLALLDFDESVKIADLLPTTGGEGSTAAKKFETSKYAAAFFPWCTFEYSGEFVHDVTDSEGIAVKTSNYNLPGSAAYLFAYGRSVQSNANWFAASGVARGVVPMLKAPVEDITEGQMHILQGDEGKISAYVNPIMMVGSYGYKIWGNRTTQVDGQTDSFFKFLNIRMLLCDIKKVLYEASLRSTFEPNDDITWINFKAMCSGLLDRMMSGRGLEWYRWKKEISTKKATIKATLIIKPIEAIESFILNVLLTEDEVSVEEE